MIPKILPRGLVNTHFHNHRHQFSIYTYRKKNVRPSKHINLKLEARCTFVLIINQTTAVFQWRISNILLSKFYYQKTKPGT